MDSELAWRQWDRTLVEIYLKLLKPNTFCRSGSLCPSPGRSMGVVGGLLFQGTGTLGEWWGSLGISAVPLERLHSPAIRRAPHYLGPIHFYLITSQAPVKTQLPSLTLRRDACGKGHADTRSRGKCQLCCVKRGLWG